MSDAASDAPPPPRRSFRPLILGGLGALLLGGGGFFAIHSGLADGLLARLPDGAAAPAPRYQELAPFTVTLGPIADGRVLRIATTLEVDPAHAATVAGLTPRLQDVLNGYLRALDPQDFDAPGALIRLRAQMLRRVQIVAGEGRVRDLLITEFVAN